MEQDPSRALLAQQDPVRAEEGIAFLDREVSFSSGNDRPLRWFSCSGTWIREVDDRASAFFAREGRRYLLLVMQEITRLKQQQEEVRHNALRALIAEQGLVHGLREAIAAAEFQLQGPFNMLKAALGILQRRGNEEHNGTVIDVLRQALASGQQALEVLRGAMPREQPEVPTRLNLNQSLRDVLSLVTERMLTLGVQVDWRPAPQLLPVIGCENRLRAIFKQLVDNALDAMDSPGIRRRELRMSTDSNGDVVRIVIEDTGPGIPDDLRLRIFEPFFSTKEAAGHAGMGLSMVREVVNQHQGTLWLERGEEGGCRVHMQLPAREAGRFPGKTL
jgi:nitrogen fixation negative regulator NifL